MPVTVVVGAQYGSEGKGVIVNHIARKYRVHVRVGGPNAGHSFWRDGRVWKMQSVPVGWTNREAVLYLGRGAIINPDILRKEVEDIAEIDPTIFDRLKVDALAVTITPEHHALEGGIHGALHERIGSTGEGVGAVRLDRLRRNKPMSTMLDYSTDTILGRLLCADTAKEIRGHLKDGDQVLVEGTQGSGLSVIHGPWPYVTTSETNAAGIIADVGISPLDVDRIILVARTFPIRVAGNSGPLKDELTWEQMSQIVGRKVEERTTVTHKIRRIGRWDDDLLAKAIALNNPTDLVITFMDYLFPECEGMEDQEDLPDTVQDWIRELEARHGVWVSMVGTGGLTWSVAE